jgi:hypothetical protein
VWARRPSVGLEDVYELAGGLPGASIRFIPAMLAHAHGLQHKAVAHLAGGHVNPAMTPAGKRHPVPHSEALVYGSGLVKHQGDEGH